MTNEPKGGLKKNRQVRIYLTEENDQILSLIRQAMPDLEETEVVRILFSTSLRAIKDNDYRITFPLRFEIVPESLKYKTRDHSVTIVNEKKR